MKIKFLSVLALFCVIFSFGTGNVQISDGYPTVDGKKYYKFAGETMTCLTLTREKIVIQSFGVNTLESKGIKEYDLPMKPYFHDVVSVGAKNYFVYAVLGAKKMTDVYLSELDVEQGKLIEAPKLLFTTKTEAERRHSFSLGVSPDQSKILLKYRLLRRTSKKNGAEEIVTCVYDSQFKLLWEDAKFLPKVETEMLSLDFFIDNAGDVFCWTKIFREAGKWNIFDLQVLKKSKGTAFSVLKELHLKDEMPKEFFFKYDANKMYCTGYYYSNANEQYEKLKSKGIIYAACDYSGLTSVSKYIALGSVFTDFMEDNQISKDYRLMSTVSLKNVELLSDGSLVYVGEVYQKEVFVEQKNWVDPGSKKRSYGFMYYKDFVVTKIDASQNVVFTRAYKKDQNFMPAGGMMFVPPLTYNISSRGNNLVLMFNSDMGTASRDYKHVDAYSVDLTTGESKFHSVLDQTDIPDGMDFINPKMDRIIALDSTHFLSEVYIKEKTDVLVKMELK